MYIPAYFFSVSFVKTVGLRRYGFLTPRDPRNRCTKVDLRIPKTSAAWHVFNSLLLATQYQSKYHIIKTSTWHNTIVFWFHTNRHGANATNLKVAIAPCYVIIGGNVTIHISCCSFNQSISKK